MTYSIPYDASYPDGFVLDANTLDNIIRNIQQEFVERIMDVLKISNFAADPLVVGGLGNAIIVATKNAYLAEFDAGSSGSSLALNFTANGPNQKIILNNNCTFTIATPPAGSAGILRLLQNGTGGWTFTLPANWNYPSNITPVFLTTANSVTLLPWYSDGSVVYVNSGGTGYDAV